MRARTLITGAGAPGMRRESRERVTGAQNKQVPLATLIAIKPGGRTRPIYRVHSARRGAQCKGFTKAGYARLLDAAH
jgi:hypothetical protein